jgi:two-component system phosphate regulon sensor histidine kinase PhoR
MFKVTLNLNMIKRQPTQYHFTDNEGNEKYKLLVLFHKEKFLLSELVSITILSIVFTFIIITYSSALNQLIRQRQISEIKTDFINNMTHEFKTPIATINLALDAIKNQDYRR